MLKDEDARDAGRTSAPASTATPTAACSSTRTGKLDRLDMITALLAEDFLKQPENKGATIVYDLRSSHVVPDDDQGRRRRAASATASATRSSRRRWPRPRRSSAASCPGHLYFRDNFFADSAADRVRARAVDPVSAGQAAQRS